MSNEDLLREYLEETGVSPFILVLGVDVYTDDYVTWLHELIEHLT